MSKKSHKNRPKSQPAKTPRQHEVSEKENQGLLTRRNALIALGAGGVIVLAWRLGLGRLFEDREQEETPNDQTANKQEVTVSPEKSPTILTPEWMKGIELPAIQVEPKPVKWDFKEKVKYFTPEIASRGDNILKALNEFYGLFDKYRNIVISRAQGMEKAEIRKEFRAFISYLVTIYKDITKTDSDLKFEDLNRILMPHDRWIIWDPVNIAFLDIEKIHIAKIRHSGREVSIPVIFLDNRQDVTIFDQTRPDADFGGLYSDEYKCILIIKNSIIETTRKTIVTLESEWKRLGVGFKPINSSVVLGNILNSVLTHEGAHTCLHKIHGYGRTGKYPIKKMGTVSMGSYQISEDNYSQPGNEQAHELIAFGTEMAKFKDTAILSAISVGGTPVHPRGYELARYILLMEIINSPYLSRDLYEKFISDSQKSEKGNLYSSDNLLRALAEIPPEGLQEIGERMAKLGIYLTQNK